MGTTHRARFTNGVLKPLGDVDLKEGDEVVFARADLAPAVLSTPTDLTGESIRRTAGAWVGHGDWESVKRMIYEARELGSRNPVHK